MKFSSTNGMAPKKAMVKKRCEIQGSGQEMAVMVKILHSKNSVPILSILTPSLFSIGTTILKNSL